MGLVLTLDEKVLPAQMVVAGVMPLATAVLNRPSSQAICEQPPHVTLLRGSLLVDRSQHTAFNPAGVLGVHMDEDVIPLIIEHPQQASKGLVVLMRHNEEDVLVLSCVGLCRH